MLNTDISCIQIMYAHEQTEPKISCLKIMSLYHHMEEDANEKKKHNSTKPLNLGLTLPKNQQPTPLNISRAPPKRDLLLTIQFQLVVLFFLLGGVYKSPKIHLKKFTDVFQNY